MTTHPRFPRIGPFAWLVLQAASVVASILLAFAIDAWWGQRLKNEEKNALLRVLREDLLSYNQDLLVQRVYRLGSRESTLALLRAIAIGRYEDTEKTLDHRISDLLWFSNTLQQSMALNALLEGDHLSAVRDPKLRNALIRFPDVLSQLFGVTGQDKATYTEAFTPFLSRNASLPQLANVGFKYGRPGDGYGADPEAPLVPVGKEVDHSTLLQDREFAGLLIRRLWNDSDVLYSIDPGKAATDALLELIDSELASTS